VAKVHNVRTGRFEVVTVMVDSGCRENFMSPNVAQRCNLTIEPTQPIEMLSWSGEFTADGKASVSWVGKDGKRRDTSFYISPESGPTDVMAFGARFAKKYPDAFEERRALPPALLTVAEKARVSQTLLHLGEGTTLTCS